MVVQHRPSHERPIQFNPYRQPEQLKFSFTFQVSKSANLDSCGTSGGASTVIAKDNVLMQKAMKNHGLLKR